MADNFEAVVIGAGPAGEVCAGELADGGLRTAIVERELVAGECSYWACMPSKVLLRAGEALVAAQRAPGAREAVSGEFDTTAALNWRDFVVDDWDDTAQTGWLEDKGIELIRGSARIQGPGKLIVGEREIGAEKIALATGSDPFIPPIEGLDTVKYWTNREATGVKELPARLVVLGGGPVGVELAQAFARLRVSVTLVEGEDRVLAREGEAASKAIDEALRAEGIELLLGGEVERVAPHGEGIAVHFGGRQGAPHRPVARRHRAPPRVGGIGLETLGIEPSPGRGRGRRAAASGRERLGDRRRQRGQHVHPRRQVPGADRRRRHARPGPG